MHWTKRLSLLLLLTLAGSVRAGEYGSGGPVFAGPTSALPEEIGNYGKFSPLVYFAPQPQTCYSPRYGCYPGNQRHIHRYPAFHGYYYRRPYNYRNVFDYPWHAGLHEPTSLFSYNVEEQVLDDHPLGASRRLPQAPVPPAEARHRSPRPTAQQASAYRTKTQPVPTARSRQQKSTAHRTQPTPARARSAAKPKAHHPHQGRAA